MDTAHAQDLLKGWQRAVKAAVAWADNS
jgi:hypothetical protein